MKIYWQNYIDGAWVDVSGGLTQWSTCTKQILHV